MKMVCPEGGVSGKKRPPNCDWKGSSSGDRKPTRARGTGCMASMTLWTICEKWSPVTLKPKNCPK
ncbi:hypothetical protein LEMLEM_LOCUS11866 [Lemmus lemmus]